VIRLISVEMKHFRVFSCPEETGLAFPGPPKLLGMERMRETAPVEAVGCIIRGGQEAKTEILT
jgi:hypothetical protein